MKKHIVYIIAGLFFVGLITGCDKDEYAELSGNGPENPGNMEIPDGYMKISFPVGTTPQTRAAVSNTTRDIASLHYLRYKKDASGNFILEQANRPVDKSWGETQTWPLTYSDVVKKGETYRFVFLGNMSPKLWNNETVVENISVNDNFNNARIHAPQSGFTAERIYYFFDSGEITVTETETNKSVPTLLKRIVTRHDIVPTTIPENVQAEGGTYVERYYNSLLSLGQPVGDKVFYTADSYMGAQLQKQLFRDIIFPILCILNDYQTLSGSTEVEQKFQEMDKDAYMSEAYGAVWNNQMTELKNWINIYAEQRNRKYVMGKDRENLLTFLNDLYKGLYASDMLAKIAKLDYPQANVQSGAIAAIPGTNCFTNAKKTVRGSLTRCGQFPTWIDYNSMNIQLQGNFPTTLDFTLSSQGTLKTAPIRNIKLSEPSPTKDRQLRVVCLAEKSTTENFGFSSLTNDQGQSVAFPEFGTNGKPLAANTFWKYYMDIQKIEFDNNEDTGETGETQKIYYSYHALITAISEKLQSPTTEELLIKNGGSVYDALVLAYHNSERDTDLQRAYGVIYYNQENSPQYGFDFKIPDLKNVKVTKVWRSEQITNEE